MPSRESRTHVLKFLARTLHSIKILVRTEAAKKIGVPKSVTSYQQSSFMFAQCTVQPLYNSRSWVAKKELLYGGDCYGEVQFIVKLHLGDIKNWLL